MLGFIEWWNETFTQIRVCRINLVWRLIIKFLLLCGSESSAIVFDVLLLYIQLVSVESFNTGNIMAYHRYDDFRGRVTCSLCIGFHDVAITGSRVAIRMEKTIYYISSWMVEGVWGTFLVTNFHVYLFIIHKTETERCVIQ